MPIYLIGFMGSGKTTIGKKLANKLGFQFVDLDALFEKTLQMSILDYFEKFGESEFRKEERKILQKSFELSKAVISCGGGTPCFFDNMELINKNGISIYIEMSAASLNYRLKNAKTQRPIIVKMNDDELTNFIGSELMKREVYYKKSKIIVKGESINIADLISRIESEKL